MEPEQLVARVAKVAAAKEHQILVEQALQLEQQIQVVELGAEALLNLVDQV